MARATANPPPQKSQDMSAAVSSSPATAILRSWSPPAPSRWDHDSSSESTESHSFAPNSRAATPDSNGGNTEAIPEDSVTCLWDDCGIVFTHLPTLIDHIHNEHIGVHKSSYTCEWSTCPRRGLPQTSRFALISHIRSHTGEKPFMCPKPECDKSFTRSDALAKHMRLQHNMSPPAPGRGGSRKRKRGAEDSSTTAAASGSTNMQGQSAGGKRAHPSSSSHHPSSVGGPPSGFTTFKVEPRAAPPESIDDFGAQREGDLFQGTAHANGRLPQSLSSGAHRAYPLPYPPSVFPPLTRGGGPDNDGTDEEDVLPDYLAKNFDPKTGLVMGKTPAMAMYILMRAKHRFVMERNRALMEELNNALIELAKAKEEKDAALDDVLKRCFGPEAENLITPIPSPPGGRTLQLLSMGASNRSSRTAESNYNASAAMSTSPTYMNGHGR